MFENYHLDDSVHQEAFGFDLAKQRQALALFDQNPALAYEFVMNKLDQEERSQIPEELMQVMQKAHLESLTSIPELSENLSNGSRGDLVRLVQMAVGVKPDGIFGSATAWGVRNFQRDNGLAQDAIVGPLTWSKLMDARKRKWDHAQTAAKPKQPFPIEDSTGESLTAHYGEPGADNLVRVTPPYPLYYQGQRVSSVQLHKLVADSFIRVMQAVMEAYTMDEIKELGLDQYGGSFADRNIRGGNRKSTHAWGIALDFDPQNNQLRWDHTKARFAGPEYEKWWACWEREGWYSLGRNHDYDWMHVQAAVRV